VSHFEERLSRAQGLLVAEGVGLLVISPGANMRYLAGFTDEAGERALLFFVPPEGEPAFLVPELYAAQVEKRAAFPPTHVWRDSQGPRAALEDILRAFPGGKVLVDDAMPAKDLLLLEELLPQAAFRPASPLMRRLRMRKSPEELSAMRRAAAIADRAFQAISARPLSGLTELEVAKALEEEMLKAGAEGAAFEILVASGPNSALPHHRAGRRRIEPGDVVILDFGCRVDGYCSDITRTLVLGEPPARVRELYEVILAAQRKAVEAVRPGLPAQEVDRAARGVIAQAGYADHFTHRTGHGIGLDVHEEPYIVEGNTLPLEEGMTFSVEPGIYFPGEFGLRVEDIVVVTEEGAESLNNCPRTLRCVG